MKTKIIIVIYLMANCVALIFFLNKGWQIESRAKTVIPASYEQLETTKTLMDHPGDDTLDSNQFKMAVKLLSDSAKIIISTIRSSQDMALRGMIMSGLNVIFFAGCLLRKCLIKSQQPQ